MNWIILIRALSGFFAALSVPTTLCALWAFGNDHYVQASLFILVLTILIVGSAVFRIASKGHRTSNARPRDVIGFLIAAWISLAFLGAIPFVNAAGDRLVVALFESVSSATTTGTSLLPEEFNLLASLFAWRGILHLTGAILSIGGMVMVVRMVGTSVPGLDAKTTAISLPGIAHQGLFRIFWAVGALVLLLSVVSGALLLIDGYAIREAFGLSVSAVTSGRVFGIDEAADSMSTFGATVLIVTMFIGMLNAVLIFNSPRKPLQLLVDAETITLATIAVILSGLVFFLFDGQHHLATAIGVAISIMSTSGLFISPGHLLDIPVPVLLFFGFMGGAAISATGGMKIYRMLVLLSQAGNEFSKLAQPHAVTRAQANESQIPARFVLTVWAYLVGFAMLSIVLAAILALNGATFEQAIVSSLGSITNSAALLTLEWIDNSWSRTFSELILSIFMVLGRLELLLLASLFFSDR